MFAQNEQAFKLHESGNTNCDNYRAIMDILLIELNKFPEAKGYVLVYEGDLEQRLYDKNAKYKGVKHVPSEIGTDTELIGYFKNHLSFRNFPSANIVFVEAGFREKLSIELWFVPHGANPPKSEPTLKKIKQRKQKHTEFGFCGEM